MPILRLDAEVLIVPIAGEVDDDDVIGFQTDITSRTAEMQARGVVIDVSALDVIDSYMARVLNDTAAMLRLLGAQVVLCGMRPAVALTLVEMGRDLIGVVTAFNLESALVRLRELISVDPVRTGHHPFRGPHGKP